MARVLGGTAVEVGAIRQALDAAGFPEGADRHVVAVVSSELDQWHRHVPADGRVVVVTAEAPTAREVWALLAAGAEDVLPWDGESTVARVVERLHRWREVDAVLTTPAVTRSVVGSSRPLRRALAELVELALFGTGPILLVGETGTGKELAARLVHTIAPGAPRGDFVVLDCTTIVPSLSGSELFGHERGAFTGADRARAGAFAAADGGTLFLDEIGELSLGLQAELLRVIQEGTYKPVGGDVWARTSFRLVSATNRDLDLEQREGRFRSDLYHRIASGIVRLPALRERPDDVERLFRHFLAEATHEAAPDVSAPVAALLQERAFPGNLRELRQLAYAVAARHCGPGPVTPGEIPARYRPVTDEPPPDRVHGSVEEAVRVCLRCGVTLAELKTMVGDLAVDLALSEHGGNVRRAAAALGVTDRAIQLRKRQVVKPREPAG